MKKRLISKVIFGAGLLGGFTIFLLLPLTEVQNILFSPGKGVHDGIVGCIDCHTAFSPSHSCNNIVCHPTIITTYKTVPDFRFHQQVGYRACTVCHLEHAGRVDSYVSRQFRHELFTLSQNPKCQTCHESPKNAVHENLPQGTSCTSCHTTLSWKEARFAHERLSATELNNCVTCHAHPKDHQHILFSDQCSVCHQPTAWKPAYVEHEGLSPQGQVSCGVCHRAPQDEDHQGIGLDCGSCHATHNW